MTTITSHRFRGTVLATVLCFIVLTPFLTAGAATRVDVEGIGSDLEVNTQQYEGRIYIDAESLFSAIGGVVFYSPIMQKVHLAFRGSKWVLSMDKGTALSDTGLEIPMRRDVFIHDLRIFITPELFYTLFGVTISPSRVPAAATPIPTVTPPEAAQPTRLNILQDVRYSSDQIENRTRITFDFVSDPPYHTVEVDNSARQIFIHFSQCSLAQELGSISLGDHRVERIDFRRLADSVETLITLNAPVRVDKGVLGGAHPRIFLDIFESIQAEREPIVEILEERPEVVPTPAISPTPAIPLPSPNIAEAFPYEEMNTRLVVIDPGHGGRDPGAVSGNILEKDVVLQISLKLRDELIKQGFQVLMTRYDDTYPTLVERTAFANHHHPLLFLSIHLNAAPNPQAHGVEAFVGSSRFWGEGAQDVAQRENRLFEGQESSIQPANDSFFQGLYLMSRELSMHFSNKLLQSIVDQTGQRNRGLKEAPLIILRGMLFPAVLFEIGFLTNAAEAQRLVNPEFHDKLIQGTVRAIKDFQGSSLLQKFIGDN
ncbi:MAG TPA: N-acetylmuramoyl-L-alanine amidase [Atribacteraceae bacterium]|nr:N-acetylmuramoyl-L-alanine amidase [Atribacteraceae bacterium]